LNGRNWLGGGCENCDGRERACCGGATPTGGGRFMEGGGKRKPKSGLTGGGERVGE